MKLYTEKQVREIMKSTHIHTDNDVDMILPQFTPIELPSDEEIHKQATNYSNFYYEFQAGAEWVVEQLKKRSNEQRI